MWKKAMDYLGLGPDDAYDDYDVEPEPAPRQRGRERGERDPRDRDPRDRDPRDHEPATRQPRYADYDEAPSRSTQRPSFPQRESDVVVRRPAPAPDDSSVKPRPINPPAQPGRGPVGVVAEPHSIRPRRFDSAQEVADRFKDGVPVILNLEGCERDVARRLIDFASGICYALNGSMEKVATGVYLLKPYGARHDD